MGIKVIVNINGRLAVGGENLRKTWKEKFVSMCRDNTKDQVTVGMCCFANVRLGNYFEGAIVSEVKL